MRFAKSKFSKCFQGMNALRMLDIRGTLEPTFERVCLFLARHHHVELCLEFVAPFRLLVEADGAVARQVTAR